MDGQKLFFRERSDTPIKNGGPCHAAAPNCDIAIKPLVLLTLVLPRFNLFILLR